MQSVTASITLSAEEHKELTALRDFWQGLDDSSVRLGLRQKGVDMRIGIDISSLTLKKQVDIIILVAPVTNMTFLKSLPKIQTT